MPFCSKAAQKLLRGCGGLGQLWEALAELWEALGELWEGLNIEKLPIREFCLNLASTLPGMGSYACVYPYPAGPLLMQGIDREFFYI